MDADIISNGAGREAGPSAGPAQRPRPARRPRGSAVLASAILLVAALGVAAVLDGGSAKTRLSAAVALSQAENNVRRAGHVTDTTTEKLTYTGTLGTGLLDTRTILNTLDPAHGNAESITRSQDAGSDFTADSTQDIRIVGDTSYLKIDATGAPARSKPWISGPLDETDTTDGSLDTVATAEVLAPLTGLTGLTDLGMETISGIPTRHLRGQAPLADNADSFTDDLRLLGDIDNSPSDYSRTQSTLDIYLDSAGQLVRLNQSARITDDAGPLAGKIFADFEATSDLSVTRQTMPIEAPPASLTETGEAFLQQLESPHP